MDDETILLVTAYHDGELSPYETLAMERRMASEPELRALVDELRRLSGQLQDVLPSNVIPMKRRTTVVEAIGLPGETSDRRRPLQWLPIAASLMIGAIVGGAAAASFGYLTISRDHTVEETLYQAHLRSLAASQPFDIASSDRHVVKPWFNGRTSIAPFAPDLSAAGFPLIGGRIDIVSGATVPVMVYRHDRHIISVTVLAGQPGFVDNEGSHDGSNLNHWTIGDLSYWAVSDLNGADLRQFVTAFENAAH